MVVVVVVVVKWGECSKTLMVAMVSSP